MRWLVLLQTLLLGGCIYSAPAPYNYYPPPPPPASPPPAATAPSEQQQNGPINLVPPLPPK